MTSTLHHNSQVVQMKKVTQDLVKLPMVTSSSKLVSNQELKDNRQRKVSIIYIIKKNKQIKYVLTYHPVA
jgi:hypothetical protein